MSFECWIFSHFIWSHRIAASLGKCSLHPSVAAVCVIPSHLNSSHVFWVFSPDLISSHVMSSLPFSALLSWSQLFSSLLMSPELFSSLLISPQLISAFQLFTALLNSSQLSTARVSSSYVFSSLLSSSELFSHLLSWSQLLSARLTSSQLSSAHSQIISPFLWPKTCSKNGSRRQSKQRLRFPHRRFEKLLHTASFCTEKLVHAEAFYTELGKLLFTASFYTKQAFVHSKLLPRKYFTHGSFYTEASTQRSFYT